MTTIAALMTAARAGEAELTVAHVPVAPRLLFLASALG